jgi:hypothetical protein
MKQFRKRVRSMNCLVLVALIACSPTIGYAQSQCCDNSVESKSAGDIVSNSRQSCCGSSDCSCLSKKQSPAHAENAGCCQPTAASESIDSPFDQKVRECQCSNGSTPISLPASRGLQSENSPTNQPAMFYWFSAFCPNSLPKNVERSTASFSSWLSCQDSPQAGLCCWRI